MKFASTYPHEGIPYGGSRRVYLLDPKRNEPIVKRRSLRVADAIVKKAYAVRMKVGQKGAAVVDYFEGRFYVRNPGRRTRGVVVGVYDHRSTLAHIEADLRFMAEAT